MRVSIISVLSLIFMPLQNLQMAPKKKTRHLTEHVTSKEQLDFKMIPPKIEMEETFIC